MYNWQDRTVMLIGERGRDILKSSHILVCGIGGVGGFCSEMLCRAGVGKITIVDSDYVDPTNINRQIHALMSNIGLSKVDIMYKRLKDINPDMEIIKIENFLKGETIEELISNGDYDYVIDAIDTISPKVAIIENTLKYSVGLVSSMGSGNRLDPLSVRIDDISKSRNCPLARVVRKRLHKKGIYRGFKVVYSIEPPYKDAVVLEDGKLENKKSIVGTISYMPAIFGSCCASVVIRDLIKEAS